MTVCVKGDVELFCRERGLEVAEVYTGNIEDYSGPCTLFVTDMDTRDYEYYYLKGRLYSRGITLISTRGVENDTLVEYIAYTVGREKRDKTGGRNMFGFRNRGEMYDEGKAVVRRILELRDAGYTYRKIQEDDGVHHLDGRKIGISTIQIILNNRDRYVDLI